MGVLSCSRPYCERIMCDTYVKGIGYVCEDCQKEFKEYISKEKIHLNNNQNINEELEKFMETKKVSYSKENITGISVDDFFKMNTK